MPCPDCNRDGGRIMSSFNAFTFRDGYPRRIPDKGTFWHMGKEVKQPRQADEGLGAPRAGEAEADAAPDERRDHRPARQARPGARDARYRSRWGIDKDGFPTVKTKSPGESAKKVLPAG